MNFYIVTPSFNQLEFLKRCVASVRDQSLPEADVNGGTWTVERALPSTSNLQPTAPALQVHHHIQDGGSTDGTADWLRRYRMEVEGGPRKEKHTGYSFSFASEADNGMYDALNKGLEGVLHSVNRDPLAVHSGETEPHSPRTDHSHNAIVSWLNCDEQYLPGALKSVSGFFRARPQTELLCGGVILVRPDGEFIALRQPVPLRKSWIKAAHLYNLSGALFFRRSVWDRGIHFDPAFRALGDEEWICRLLAEDLHTSCTAAVLTAFTFTGSNLSCDPAAQQESQILRGTYPLPGWKRALFNALRWIEKCRSGAYRRQALDYALYIEPPPDHRVHFHIDRSTHRWPQS